MRGYLGNQGRNNRQGGNKQRGRGGPDGNRGPRQDELPQDDFLEGDDLDIISPAELEASRKSMNLSALKHKPIPQLLELAQTMGLENLARSRKQDIIFSILKAHSRNGESIYGDGVLEILQDGFGFLRSPEQSYLAGPDDIYISPSQIRRFNLRTGDTHLRPHPPAERWRALLRAAQGRRDQLRFAGQRPQQGPVREPHAAAPDASLQAGARHGQHRRPHRAHDRPDRAAR